MMIVRRAAVLVAAIMVFGLVNTPPTSGQEDPTSAAVQEEAAAEVQQQLEGADGALASDEIDELGRLGPPPWLSLGRERSETVVETWVDVAAQLPAHEQLPVDGRRGRPRFTEVSEREAPGETGVNDTPATGQRIPRFGTGRNQNRAVTIEGHLSGAEPRLPVPFDCFSTEDDGSIPLANPVPAFDVALCAGEIGDGPHGSTTGDIDVFSYGEVAAGSTLILDSANVSDSLQAAATTLAIYDAAGNLLGSVDDSGDPNLPEFLVVEAPADGEYFGFVVGAGPLPTDPFDPTSGAGVTTDGTYDLFVVTLPPPCVSVEDDGSIPLANDRGDLVDTVEFCLGFIGDGPFGASTGDADFYRVGTVPEGDLILADVVHFENPDGVETTVAIYDGAGNLVASIDDSGDPELPEFLEVPAPATGEYVVAVVGAGPLPSDPFDSSSGAGVTDTGGYEVVIGSVSPPPPPCFSDEDDGAIPLANDASGGTGDDELFVTFCDGFVGDGPQAGTGDVDFYSTRVVQEGKELVVDLVDFGPDPVIENFVVGIYDEAGDLVLSGQDSDGGEAVPGFVQLTVPATGVYHVAITGGLPTDPFDSTTGTDTAVVGPYGLALVDTTQEVIDGIVGPNWGVRRIDPASLVAARDGQRAETRAAALAALEDRRDEIAEAMADAEPVIDVDVYLVDLEKGDAISGGFDSARVAGIIDPGGTLVMQSGFNPSFIYPADSPLRHDRRVGFDHVVTRKGRHAVFVTEGDGPYEGQLQVVKAGRADEPGQAQQIIFVDFDGAEVSPDLFFGPPPPVPTPAQPLSPLADFLPAWGLEPADEDAVIDAVLDAMVENLDTDLRIVDGRNGNRDRQGRGTQFDIEILNSRDHGDRWGDPDVSRIVVGGTIDQLQIPTIGIAQSIDPGNTDSTETGVVLLDLLSSPAGDPISLNSYGLANGATKIDLIGFGVGHIAAHEVGHFIGNWHTETFNPQPSLMDAGGEFESIFGVGPDGVLGTADDVDPDFVVDVFNTFEGFGGIEDTTARSAYALSTGQAKGPEVTTGVIGDSVTEESGLGAAGVTVHAYEHAGGGALGPLVDSTTTNYAGFYWFTLDAGCYRIRFVAPEGREFVNGKSTATRTACIAGGQTKLQYDAVLAAP